MSDVAGVVREFASELADALAEVASDALVGIYLHGSAVMGDWNARASDVDVLVVVDDDVTPSAAERLAAVLSTDRSCPGAGLEASVVKAGAASVPAAPWPFVVHVTTNPHDRGPHDRRPHDRRPHDRRVVWGTPGRGDADLILHYAVAREHGWAAYGSESQSVVGAIPESIVTNQLARELRWAVDHAVSSYAILNACRALRYRDERVLCSKTDGGKWALARRIQPVLVQGALDERRLGVSSPTSEAAAAWVLIVAADLS